MHTKMHIENPNEIEFTLTLTMKLGKWKELRDQITENWPGWEFRVALTDMIYKANRTFVPDEKPEAE